MAAILVYWNFFNALPSTYHFMLVCISGLMLVSILWSASAPNSMPARLSVATFLGLAIVYYAINALLRLFLIDLIGVAIYVLPNLVPLLILFGLYRENKYFTSGQTQSRDDPAT